MSLLGSAGGCFVMKYILSVNCHCDVMQVDSIKSYYYSTQILSVGWLYHIDVFKFKVQVLFAVDRCMCYRIMRFTDNPCKPSNEDRFVLLSLRGRFGPSIKQKCFALNCYYNYMIDHAK